MRKRKMSVYMKSYKRSFFAKGQEGYLAYLNSNRSARSWNKRHRR